MRNLSSIKLRYQTELFNSVIPFWEKHSLDRESGGFFTCLDRKGAVYDTDKFIWLQARQSWMFSTFCLDVEPRKDWKEIAKHGVDFIAKYGHRNGDYYFSVDKDGLPLIEPYNIFSDCFACMAYAAYYRISGEESSHHLAVETFRNIKRRMENPKGQWEKSTGNRPIKGFALPMILSNLVLEMEELLDKSEVESTIQECSTIVMETFREKESGLIHEFVTPEGHFLSTFEGRLLNPGHGIEAMGFMLDIADRSGDQNLAELAVNSILATLRYSWDNDHGGIYYFLDNMGHPPQQLEWDQKLWWVHLETLVALLKGFKSTQNKELLTWFDQVDTYTWSHFPDPEFGEWYGYLNRQGEPLLDLKGGKWKGCFHVPRGLLKCVQALDDLTKA